MESDPLEIRALAGGVRKPVWFQRADPLQDWELGRTQPPSAVRAYFIVIDRFPGTVERALKGTA